ncbi:MAG: Gfo/Idh/MocA family oxidoreductase [Acidobacteriaceae bacterium]
MNRRRLLQGLSFSMLAAKLSGTSTLYGQTEEAQAQPMRTLSANDRIQVGFIGPGSRGQELIRQLLRTPGVDIAAQCDVYEPRFAEVNEMVGKTVPSHKDYRELLDRKDLDVIFIATPPVFHASYSIAAMKSGRPVYCEKTIGFTPEDCANVVDSVRKTGQIYQVGHQMRYASWIADSINRVHKGDIGEPTHVYGYWHRSDNWRREVPNPSLEHLMNWRLYRESSGGLLEELGSHHIDIANWVFGEQPQTLFGTSSIAVYHDGRTVGDNVQAVLGYSKGRRMFFSSLTDNGLMADQVWVYGTEGSLQITLADATLYKRTSKMITEASHSDVVQKGVETGASYNTDSAIPYRGPGQRVGMKQGEDPTLTACKSFMECVRKKKQPFANVDVGYKSAIACSIGRHAMYEGHLATIPQLTT